MTHRRPRHLADLFEAGNLAKIAQEAEKRLETTVRVRSMLPADEAKHLVSARFGPDGELVLAMDSAAWAAKVRYRQEQLGAKRLRVRVVPRA